MNKANSAFWQNYFKITVALEVAIEWISAAAFLGITLVTLMQVFFRFVLHNPLIWSEELARYLGILVVMVASANALRHNEHIGIDVFSSKLPASMARPVQAFYSLVIVAVMGFLSYYSFVLMRSNFFTPTPAMRIPIGIPYLGMTIGCLASALAGLCSLIESLFLGGQDKEKEDGVA